MAPAPGGQREEAGGTRLILEREFSKRGLELHRWLESSAEVVWESTRALERTWGEVPRLPWGSADHQERERARAAILVDLRPAPPLEISAKDPVGLRARAKARIRRALIVALFPEDLLVDGHLPLLERIAR